MNILTSDQLRDLDNFTINSRGIKTTDLMEQAAQCLFEWLHSKFQGEHSCIKIFCGKGNNGGDGLALARLLITHGYRVESFVMDHSNQRTEAFLENYNRLKDEWNHWPSVIASPSDFPAFKPTDLIIDALFGIGLSRPLSGIIRQLVKHLNSNNNQVIAVDCPTGLFADKPNPDEEGILQADFTLTFQAPKLSFFFPASGKFVGQWFVLDIGLDKTYAQQFSSNYTILPNEAYKIMWKPRPFFSHKGTFGHALLIGGSRGKLGAAVLMTKACLRSGAGLATACVPKNAADLMHIAVPEAMVVEAMQTDFHDELPTIDFQPNVIAIGPGLGQNSNTLKVIEMAMELQAKNYVFDADAINLISKSNKLLAKLPPRSIFTPHPKELERLLGSWNDDLEKLEKCSRFSKKHNVILVVKGAYTAIIDGSKVWFNSSGNPALATAGSGDVLTGIIAGLLSQDYAPQIAALLGVYLHGLCADLYTVSRAEPSMIASDIIALLGDAMAVLIQNNEKA